MIAFADDPRPLPAPAKGDLFRLRVEVEEIDSLARAEEALAIWERAKAYAALAREVAQEAEEALKRWIEAHGAIDTPDSRFYVGTTKEYRMKVPKEEALGAVFSLLGGDVGAVAACQPKSPWLTGALRNAIGDEAFDQLFETTLKTDLRTGAPKREVKRIPAALAAK